MASFGTAIELLLELLGGVTGLAGAAIAGSDAFAICFATLCCGAAAPPVVVP